MTPTTLSRESKTGRPPANPATTRFWETPLHLLLVENLNHIEGMVAENRIVASVLAKALKCCRFTVYRWLNENKISPRGARKVIEISDGRLTKENFASFLIL